MRCTVLKEIKKNRSVEQRSKGQKEEMKLVLKILTGIRYLSECLPYVQKVAISQVPLQIQDRP